MRLFNFSLLLLLFLTACQSEEKSTVEQDFIQFQEAVIQGDNKVIYELLDVTSRDYFQKIATLTLQKDATANTDFYQQQVHPLSSLMLLQASTLIAESENKIVFSPLNVIVVAQLLEIGILNANKQDQFRFDSIDKEEEIQATIVVNSWLEKDVWVKSFFKMYKENGTWKLSFSSTQKVLEKFLATEKIKSGKSDAAFIRDVILDGFN